MGSLVDTTCRNCCIILSPPSWADPHVLQVHCALPRWTAAGAAGLYQGVGGAFLRPLARRALAAGGCDVANIEVNLLLCCSLFSLIPGHQIQDIVESTVCGSKAGNALGSRDLLSESLEVDGTKLQRLQTEDCSVGFVLSII